MPAADTTPEAARRQREVLAAKSPSERAEMALEMSELVRQLTIDGIRLRHPGISDDELQLQLIERLHGRALAQAVADARSAAGRNAMSGSDTQRRDVVAMIAANRELLDRAYLAEWAEQLGVDELLEAMWQEALDEP